MRLSITQHNTTGAFLPAAKPTRHTSQAFERSPLRPNLQLQQVDQTIFGLIMVQ